MQEILLLNASNTSAVTAGFNYTPLLTGLIIFFLIYFAVYVASLFLQSKLEKKQAETGVLLEISLEKDSEKDAFNIEQLWSSFHGLRLPWYKALTKAQPVFTFEIKSENNQKTKQKEITFNIWIPKEYVLFVRQKILAEYPYAEIRILKKDYIPSHKATADGGGLLTVEIAELGLKNDSAFSIRTFEDLDTDPLNALTSTMTELDNKEVVVYQLIAQPIGRKWNKKAEKVLTRFERTGKMPTNKAEWTNFFYGFLKFFFVIIDGILSSLFQSKMYDDVEKVGSTSVDKDRQKEIGAKAKKLPYRFQIRLLVATPYDSEVAQQRIRNMVASLNEFEGPYNGLRKDIIYNKKNSLERIRNRELFVLNRNDVVTNAELVGLAHLPNKDMKTPGLKKILSKKVQAPINLGTENAFAVAEFREGKQYIGLDEKARMRHLYVTGMTGVGKSTLLENMIVNDIESGNGCVVIDPHGELCDVILEKVSSKREDIYLLDPSDLAFPFGMNLLEVNSQDPLKREMEKVLVIDSYITIMKRVFGEGAIGPNTDDLFRMSCSAILDHPEGGGLMEMVQMLTSDMYRAKVIPYITDPIVKDYWEKTFAALVGDVKFQTQNLNAPLNKLRRFVANGIVANIICQQKSTLNIAEVMNSGGVILARFSRGDMGFENSALLGSMLIARIQIAAMQRVNIPQEQRVPCYLYIDEFQNFIGDSSGAKTFAEILSEARKYKLGLVKNCRLFWKLNRLPVGKIGRS